MKNRNIRKALGIVIVGMSLAAWQLVAAPLDESKVAKEAKWLTHIDVDELMRASFADYAIEKLKQEIEKANESSIGVDVELVLKEIKSITAYGTSLGGDENVDGVVLLRSGPRLRAIIDGYLAHNALMAEGEGQIDFEELENRPYTTYLIEKELYLAFPSEDLVIGGKDLGQVDRARAVFEGEKPNLSQLGSDSPFLKTEGKFFFIASAVGLNRFDGMPPQARVLQKTNGGQISIGEQAGEMVINLILSTDSKDVSEKVYHIMNGFVALASFATVENQGMLEIVEKIKVSTVGKSVTLDFRYPTDLIVDLLRKVVGEEEGQHATISSRACKLISLATNIRRSGVAFDS